MSKTRPENKTLIKNLWDYVRSGHSLEIPTFIYNWAQSNYLDVSMNDKDEMRVYRLSVAHAGPNNPSSKGLIYAINLKTDEITLISSRLEMLQLGFTPSAIYNCVNGIAYTHKGHVFIRAEELKRTRKPKRIPK